MKINYFDFLMWVWWISLGMISFELGMIFMIVSFIPGIIISFKIDGGKKK